MRVFVQITFTDQTSEEEMAASGVPSSQLLKIYTEAFQNMLQSIQREGVKTDLHVVVTDNTKEGRV